MAIRNNGDWEGWLKFFLRGIYEVSQDGANTARKILALKDQHYKLLLQYIPGNTNSLHTLDYLFAHPLINVRMLAQHLNCVYGTANKLVEQFVKLRLLKETSQGHRNRRYIYAPYLDLFESSLNSQSDSFMAHGDYSPA